MKRAAALVRKDWFKLICGASYQHLPAIRSLAIAYTIAGADCIDVAADPAVIKAAQQGIAVGTTLAQHTPLLMMSINDGEDPHFRKAWFDTKDCPPACPRPCIKVCPASAIVPQGIISAQCYGCGRCLPICPLGLIEAQNHCYTPEAIPQLMLDSGVQGLEIHTQTGRLEDFTRLWQIVKPSLNQLEVIAISCPNHSQLIPYLQSLQALIGNLPIPLIWQTDGRPMSGDLGKGTTQQAIELGLKVTQVGLKGYIQLAGGTNGYTVAKLEELGQRDQIDGVAYGSYARTLLNPILEELDQRDFFPNLLEEHPDLLQQAVKLAQDLVQQLKQKPHRLA